MPKKLTFLFLAEKLKQWGCLGVSELRKVFAMFLGLYVNIINLFY